ncbi:MAG TPA: hypothetical protein VF331_13865 [Polyangiales bacterium]
MPRPHAEKQRATQIKPSPAAPSETEFQKQRADSEGMTPNKPQAEKPSQNQGEGNRTADRSYRQGLKRFLKARRSGDAIEETARAIDGEAAEAMRHAAHHAQEPQRR